MADHISFAKGPRTAAELLDLLDMSVTSAAAGAGLELGLFELLSHEALDAGAVGVRLGIPSSRARSWLQVLEHGGLVSCDEGRCATSADMRFVLGTYSPDTWAFLALEARERRGALADLPRRLRARRPPVHRPDYVARMAADPDRARRFTRMLGEIHRPLATRLAATLELDGVRCLLDLGGGSGVVSMALARRFTGLTSTVVDIETVCAAGREMAEEAGLADRVRYLPIDLGRDALPAGADAVIECDVGLYDEALFRRVLAALRPGGRFLIVDRLPASPDAPPAEPAWRLVASLAGSELPDTSLPRVETMLRSAGFAAVSHRPVAAEPVGSQDPFGGETLIEAWAPGPPRTGTTDGS